MAVNDKSFFQYKESRALAGYKSAWLVKLPSNGGKYSLIGATETVPYVFGDKETFDFNLLQAPVIGQVEGKLSLESQDIEVLHHRDNAYRFEKLKGQVLDFMCINAEYVGYKFSGTLDYRPNNAEADINRATVTIVPMDAEVTPIWDARGEIIETLCFADEIPATVKTGVAIDFGVKQSAANVSFNIVKIASGTNVESAASATTDYTLGTTDKKITFNSTGLFAITATATNYASWTTTVYVEAASATNS